MNYSTFFNCSVELEGKHFGVALEVGVSREDELVALDSDCADQNIHHRNCNSFSPTIVACLRSCFIIGCIDPLIGECAKSVTKALELCGRLDTGKKFLPNEPEQPRTTFPDELSQLLYD